MQRSQDEILDLYNALKAFYQDFHDQCDTEDTYYNREFHVEVGDGGTAIKLPTAQDAIDDAAAQVDTTTINIVVPPRITTYGSHVDADRIRKFELGCWHMLRQYEGLVLFHSIKHAFLYGMSCLKLVADPDGLFEMPVIPISPHSFFPDPSNRFVIEAYERRKTEVKAEFPDAFGDEGSLLSEGDNSDALWLEYWDDTHVVYLYDDVVVDSMEHGYGFLPYFWGDAGLGYHSKKRRPEDLYRGLLYDVHDLLVAESRVVSQAEAISKQHAWPEIDIIAQSLTQAKVLQQAWESGPGHINAYDQNITVNRIQPQSPPPEILRLHGLLVSLVENSTVPRVARGERPVGASSGYMTAILSGLARLKFGGVVSLIVSLIQQINEGFCKLVENVFGEVTVFGLTSAGEQITETISYDEIDGHYINFVDISAIPPEEQERTLMVGSRLLAQQQISRRYFVTHYLKPTDPEAELEQQDVDKIMALPEVQQLILSRTVETFGMSQMLGDAGADKAQQYLLGTQGSPNPPMGGTYTEQDRGYGRPTQAGSIDELSQVLRAQGAEGIGSHVANARREVIDKVKGKKG